MRRLLSTGALLLTSAAAAGCATSPAPASSELAPYAFAASDYLHSPLREQNDDGESYEEIVARCMKEQGFDYRSVADSSPPPPESSDTQDAEESLFALPDAASAGCGAVFGFEEFGDVDDIDEETPYASDETVDSLSATAMDAYTTALYGSYGTDADLGSDDTWEWKRAGCAGYAEHELTATSRRPIENPYESLMTAILETPEAVWDTTE